MSDWSFRGKSYSILQGDEVQPEDVIEDLNQQRDGDDSFEFCLGGKTGIDWIPLKKGEVDVPGAFGDSLSAGVKSAIDYGFIRVFVDAYGEVFVIFLEQSQSEKLYWTGKLLNMKRKKGEFFLKQVLEGTAKIFSAFPASLDSDVKVIISQKTHAHNRKHIKKSGIKFERFRDEWSVSVHHLIDFFGLIP